MESWDFSSFPTSLHRTAILSTKVPSRPPSTPTFEGQRVPFAEGCRDIHSGALLAGRMVGIGEVGSIR